MQKPNYNESVRHVCYLLDGSRTFAMINGIRYEDIDRYAYESGAEALKNLMSMTFDELHIPFLSVALSTRSNRGREASMKVLTRLIIPFFCEKWMDYFVKNRIRVRFVGDLELFCSVADDQKGLNDAIKRLEYDTRAFTDYYLIVMVAYDSRQEYLKLIRSQSLSADIKSLIDNYYGFNVPDVDLLIRSWRPRLSACIPILVGEYADIYLFPAPFQCFDMVPYKKIISDYSKRLKSKGGSFIYTREDVEQIKMQGSRIKRSSTEPLLLGTTVGNAWLPMSDVDE